jgi:hypothetical protein
MVVIPALENCASDARFGDYTPASIHSHRQGGIVQHFFVAMATRSPPGAGGTPSDRSSDAEDDAPGRGGGAK